MHCINTENKYFRMSEDVFHSCIVYLECIWVYRYKLPNLSMKKYVQNRKLLWKHTCLYVFMTQQPLPVAMVHFSWFSRKKFPLCSHKPMWLHFLNFKEMCPLYLHNDGCYIVWFWTVLYKSLFIIRYYCF